MASVQLQHKTRREGLILVDGARYDLDKNGCVYVTPEHAETLQQGSMWRSPEHWEARRAAVSASQPPPVSASGARRARTPEELKAAATAAGIAEKPKSVEKPKQEKPKPPVQQAKPRPKLKPQPAPEPSPTSEEEEVIEISENTKRSELIAIAAQIGLDVTGKTKAQIIDMIEEAS